MNKITWQHLGLIYEKQFGVTPEEASEIIAKEIFSHNWKHGFKGKVGRMWHDEVVVANFTHVLEEEERLAKKVGRKRAVKELFFTSDKIKVFMLIASLKYKFTKAGFKTFKNDYAKWKRLKFFKSVWKRGSRVLNKLRKRTAAKINKYEAIVEAENISMGKGIDRRKEMIASGKYKEVKSQYGDWVLQPIIK